MDDGLVVYRRDHSRCGAFAPLPGASQPGRCEVTGRGLRSAHAAALRLDLLQRTVVVAMSVVGVMEVAVDQVIDMVAMRNRLVAAAGPVHVRRIVRGARVSARALAGVGRGDSDAVLFDHPGRVLVVQVAVMQVIDMPLVVHRGMAAARFVAMGVVGMSMRVG